MPKNKTPLLRPLRENGATLYVFPSASEDIGLNINNGTNGVALSHYALLNLKKSNFGFTDPVDIIKSLQNYAMNFETVLINDSKYNFQEPYTVSENVFWHWLFEKGWKKSSGNASESLFNPIETGKNIYREKNYSSKSKDRIVQCFGSIDSGNSLSTEFGMFNETYVTIPTSYGNGPVFFRVVDNNENYSSTKTYYGTASNLEGRSSTDVGYLGNVTPEFDASDYYKDPLPIEIIKDIPTIQAALRLLGNDDTISVTSYDDVNIDQNGILKTIETSTSPYDMSEGCEYCFNAILLYYSIYDTSDVYKQAVATNLFGIVFLDGGTSADSNYLLTPMTKKKSYSGQTNKNAYFGNSFSFRVNIKTLSVYDNTDARIDDNTTTTSAYAVDFNDVISNLNRAIDVMNTNVQSTMAIQDRYMTIMSYYTEIRNKLSEIENDLSLSIDNKVNNAVIELKKEIEDEISKLNIEDKTLYSSDGTPLMNGIRNLASPKKVYSVGAQHSNMGNVRSAATEGSEYGNGQIGDTKVNITSASSVNIVADTTITITSEDVKFNIKNGNEKMPVTLLVILKKIEELQNAIIGINNTIALKNDDTVAVVSSVDDSSVNEQVYSSPESISNDVTEILIAAGIIPINGLLLPRVKKPEEPGYYLKQNASGNIVNYVLFDGNEYTETIKCECGKLYSMNGLMYTFNGDTCKLLGQP